MVKKKTKPKKKSTKAAGRLTVKGTKKPVPTSEVVSDVAWLDEGILPPEDTMTDAELASLPGRIVDIPVDSIDPNSWNPNVQNDKQFDMLTRRMNEVGMIAPIQVVPTINEETGEERYMILGGEHRWRAAKALQWPTIPCLVLVDERFANEDLQKFVTLQLNMISGNLNPEKFVKLYEQMAKQYDNKSLKDLMGFTDSHKFNMLTKGIAQGLPDDVKDEFERRSKNVKNPEDLKKILNELLGKYGDDLRFNFMIFTHEGKDHVWIRCEDRTHKALKEVLDICRARAVDVNVVLEDALKHALGSFK